MIKSSTIRYLTAHEQKHISNSVILPNRNNYFTTMKTYFIKLCVHSRKTVDINQYDNYVSQYNY